MVIEKLKTAGFNDDEIKTYVNDKSEKLLQGGFNEQEVNKYFGIKEPDRNIIKDYWNGIKKNFSR